jgi:hypothetical protein
MVREFLPRSQREFVKVTQDESMRNVLITEALLGLEVVGILGIPSARKLRKLRQGAVGVSESF